MSVEATMQVLDRTMHDETFLDRFRTDPEAAIVDYDLTDEEIDVLAQGDETRLRDALDILELAVAVVVIVIKRGG